MRFVITPAGLFDSWSESGGAPLPPGDGLTLTIELGNPFTLGRQLLTGQRPEARIEGDAALAEVASWLMNHLRWTRRTMSPACWAMPRPSGCVPSVTRCVRRFSAGGLVKPVMRARRPRHVADSGWPADALLASPRHRTDCPAIWPGRPVAGQFCANLAGACWPVYCQSVGG